MIGGGEQNAAGIGVGISEPQSVEIGIHVRSVEIQRCGLSIRTQDWIGQVGRCEGPFRTPIKRRQRRHVERCF